MESWFVGPVMGKIIDACFEYLKDQVRWQTGMKEELQKLQIIHPKIQAVVFAYSQAQIEDPALIKWYWQLRDAIDEADDVLDEFEYWKREIQVSKNKKIRKVRSLMKSLKKKFVKICKRALKIDANLKRLEGAVHKLYDVSDEVRTFLHLLDRANQKQKEEEQLLTLTRETGSTPPANDFLGRSNDMEFVRNWLKEISNTNISVLSVVGHGGMGKTTLLQHVYSDGITEVFDVKMWVCVSINFDANMVIKNILESLKKERPNLETYEALQSCLQSEVSSKRFLLVLDDIWEDDETKWEKVLAPLYHGSSESKILITTRMDSVASMFAKIIKNNEKWQLEGLEKDDCLRLLNTHAFAGVENPDDELRYIAAKMVEKLSGCPLATKVIGGVLNSYVDKSYWKQVLNTNIENIEPSQNYLLRILKLSYIYLDKSLQNCFSFCCIFPQDHEFDKDDLVRMWISLSFIQSSGIQGETLEDTGRRYFNILIQKSFFDEFRRHERVYYKMHDLLHELAQSVSTKECFRVDYAKEFPIPPKTIRHLYNDTRISRLEAVFQKMKKFENLRSLFLSFTGYDKFDENVISEIMKASKSIRLLVISCWETPKIPDGIVCLIHLRYLKLECKKCSGYFCRALRLPRFIGHLYHLEFIISKKLQILEMDNIGCQLIMDELIIKDLSMLLMEPLRSISSFSSLTIGENNELVSFPIETEQWFLQHTSSLFGLKFQTLQSLQSLPSSFESFSSLNDLYVYNVPQLKLLPNPPASLTSLYLNNLESLQCLPSSLSTISSLKILELKNIPCLKSLPDLPSSLTQLNLEALQCCLPSCLSTISSLKILELKNIPPLKSSPDLPSSLTHLTLEALQCLTYSLSTFSSLNYLVLINIPLLKSLPDLPSSMETLELKELESLQCLPSSLSTISSLQFLELRNIPLLKSLPNLPSSLSYLYLEELENLDCLSSSLPTTLQQLRIIKVPRLLELPDLPSSVKRLVLKELESLQCLPSSLPTFSSLKIPKLKNIPLLKSLPDLPSSLWFLGLEELENLGCLPSCLPTTLLELWIIKVPHLLELPVIHDSLIELHIEDCHPQLMEQYPNFSR